eukprot:maker-scaffold45_size475391-snap-gene-1.19 protein:Tk10516 transcript:maker-scaffold45_size475391-snap-gene-1.19-mRNA-1 annotation:"hypothetical protein IscW_ISCW023191"
MAFFTSYTVTKDTPTVSAAIFGATPAHCTYCPTPIMPAEESAPPSISWVPSATGERFPIRVDVNHPMWKAFLESGSLSPSQFFRTLLSPANSYFQSPTPWGAHRRLAEKVSELLDSFRPGAYSYRPFRRQIHEGGSRSTWSRRRSAREPTQPVVRVTHQDPVRQIVPPFPMELEHPVDHAPHIEPSVYMEHSRSDYPTASGSVDPSSSITSRFQDLEDVRRRVYVDLGRPRPFYRRPSADWSHPQELSVHHAEPKSLEELVKISLVRSVGLAQMKLMFLGSQLGSALPNALKERMLTFLCEDFEEIPDEDAPTMSLSLAQRPASYKVQCLHDGEEYLAIFATSEADKHASNLWEEYRTWLSMDNPMITSIYALVADPLTENVFFIVKPCPPTLATIPKDTILGQRMLLVLNELKTEYVPRGIPDELFNPESIGIQPLQFQNPILFSRFRNAIMNNEDAFQREIKPLLVRGIQKIALSLDI